MQRLFLLLTLLVNLTYAQSENDEISKGIKTKIVLNLSKIPSGSEKLYGFDSRADFDKCTLGIPIRMAALAENNTLTIQDQWRVPVKLNGKNKTLFTVQKIDNVYEIVDIGGVGLSRELQAIENSGISVKYFLRLYRQKIDFVSDAANLNNLAEVSFMPLQSVQLFLSSRQKHRAGARLSFSELLTLIQ